MKKAFLFCLIFIALISVSVFAEGDSFDKVFSLSDTYKSINFDSNSELSDFTGSFECKDGIFGADGRVLKISDAVFGFAPDVSHAKCAAVFDVFIPDKADETKITVNLENGEKVFDFSAAGGEISVKCENDEVFKILSGKHYKFGFLTRKSFISALTKSE